MTAELVSQFGCMTDSELENIELSIKKIRAERKRQVNIAIGEALEILTRHEDAGLTEEILEQFLAQLQEIKKESVLDQATFMDVIDGMFAGASEGEMVQLLTD